jgi:hypothetical protein
MFQQFFHGSLQRYTLLFGTLFNSITITRTDAANTVSSFKVPLVYSPKDPMIVRIKQDPTLDKDTAITLPHMSFDRGMPVYRGDRKLNNVGRVVRRNDTNPNKFLAVYNPVPYDIPFNLYVYVKNQLDADKIVEQIYPYFTPSWAASVNILPEMNITSDVEIVYHGGSIEDTYETDLKKRRAQIYTLTFTMKANFYGPIKNKPIIKFVTNDFFFGNPAENDVSDVVDRLTVTPGMLANGEPTSNSSLSVDPNTIFVNDDWDYCVDQSGLILTE